MPHLAHLTESQELWLMAVSERGGTWSPSFDWCWSDPSTTLLLSKGMVNLGVFDLTDGAFHVTPFGQDYLDNPRPADGHRNGQHI